MKRFLLSLVALAFLTVSAEAANRFLTCNTTCTITATDMSIWGSVSGGTGASVPGSGDAVILDAGTCVGGTTCTATMGPGYNPTWQSINMDACTASTAGCILDFSAHDNNITLTTTAGFSGGGTGTRTLNMGNGTWTLSSGAATWSVTSSITLNANSSTISYSATSLTGTRVFTTGGKTYNAVTFASPSPAQGQQISIANAATIASLTFGAGNYVVWTTATTYTITTLNATGTAAQPIIFFSSTSAAATLALTTATMTWNVIKSMTCTGSPTATNSLDGGGNSGCGIVAPVLGGGRIIGG